ncbi:30S ribosomal protein S10 [Haloferax mediterranei ATCC 33500]|uniref:Small ribosomal subunit protein uS10 n=1 Tax=Haloferax mediterranei (strain ATCC 33500 / DSM 1411 / JCM 8866 / NBRC 14739 / NCIMB 2177 / R-4) TaxID=523841 RepID=I3R4L6_HALMT|nr:uS10/mL48 family ribosomal protein [Haloferax mediterranei]AFK19176.1 ribosomal protein S10-like protein [Haloferax mediterranei ATCC 33500]EMA03921.1 ribosomal protein S10-like protein [Haloferax mediterranei ATCC 33500]MDX5989275.1 uS10/mL48 family ribosomal protein [Haloferax mediterranei ATCC 33500]QCQ75646.1 30S ribosomal protein S10 [Haloferax mediterranei ATCC 33500]
MTFVTKLTFQSGDKAVLDRLVGDLKEFVERKGAECRGPHADQPKQVSVPQYRTLQPGNQFSSWSYPVFTRRLEIHGADHIAREVGHKEFPDSVHVEIEVEQKKPLGHRR